MLKNAREMRGLTQKELGRLSGLSQSYISKLESPDIQQLNAPSLKQITRLAKELHICPFDLTRYFLKDIIKSDCACTIFTTLKTCNSFMIKHQHP